MKIRSESSEFNLRTRIQARKINKRNMKELLWRRVLLKLFKTYLRSVIEIEREISKRRRLKMDKTSQSFQIVAMVVAEKIMDRLKMLIL